MLTDMTIRCDVCGASRVLDTDAVIAAAEILTFTDAHSEHVNYRIDLLVEQRDHPLDPGWAAELER